MQRQEDPPSPTRWEREGSVLIAVLMVSLLAPLLAVIVVFGDQAESVSSWVDGPTLPRLRLVLLALGLVAGAWSISRATQ